MPNNYKIVRVKSKRQLFMFFFYLRNSATVLFDVVINIAVTGINIAVTKTLASCCFNAVAGGGPTLKQQ